MNEYVNPDRDTFRQFRELPPESPIHMLNLVRLKETAVYEDGTMVSGREAYAAYGRDSASVFQQVGGRIVWSGDFELMLIGPADEHWDIAFIAEYPSGQAFVEMIKNETYQRAVKHRTAAVETSRLVRLSPKKSGDQFG